MAVLQKDGSASKLSSHRPCSGVPSVHLTSDGSAPLSTAAPPVLRDAISEELAELDVKEKAIMEPISRRRVELRWHWNRSLPIHNIPNELLVQIFAKFPHFPRRRRDSYTSAQEAWLDVGWPGLMLICRHWRDLLVSTPSFWREVHSQRKADWSNLCISRSAAISIDVYVEPYSPLKFLDKIRPHVHRLREFHLSIETSDSSLLTAVIPFFDGAMRLLEKLRFSTKAVRNGEVTSRIDARITSERFPSLRVLVLQSPMVAPQDISLYAQLRTLELNGCSPPLSLDGFLDALAASVQLEELRLIGGIIHRLSGEWPHGAVGRIPYRPPVPLPRLRDFVLVDYRIDRISCFLAHLRLQPFTGLRIEARALDQTTNTFDAMLPLNRTTVIPFVSLASKAWLNVHGSHYSLACRSAGPLGVDDDCVEDYTYAGLTLDSGNRTQLWDRAMGQGLGDLVQAFGTSPLTFLCVHGDQGQGTAAAWERVFRTFPLLEELSIDRDCDDTRDVTDVFRGLHAASVGFIHADSAVACPNLKEFRLSGTSTVATFEAMRDCFRYRGDRGVVLESLNIHFLIGWEDLPAPLRLEIVRDISSAVKVIRTATSFNVSEWGGGHQENDDSSDELALVM